MNNRVTGTQILDFVYINDPIRHHISESEFCALAREQLRGIYSVTLQDINQWKILALQDVEELKHNYGTGIRWKLEHELKNIPVKRKKVKCYNCGKLGTHIAKECRGERLPRKIKGTHSKAKPNPKRSNR